MSNLNYSSVLQSVGACSLTKWMFALNRMSLARGVPHYNHLALQLAKGAPSRLYDVRCGGTKLICFPAVACCTNNMMRAPRQPATRRLPCMFNQQKSQGIRVGCKAGRVWTGRGL